MPPPPGGEGGGGEGGGGPLPPPELPPVLPPLLWHALLHSHAGGVGALFQTQALPWLSAPQPVPLPGSLFVWQSTLFVPHDMWSMLTGAHLHTAGEAALSHWQFVVSSMQLLSSFRLQSTALPSQMSWGVPHWQSLQSIVVNQLLVSAIEGS